MSSFTVPGVRLDKIGDHPNADRLDITHVGGYQAITQKGRFKTGDLAIYIPEAAVVPEEILKVAGFWDEEKNHGTLAGANHDRVKAVKLRGIVSQGILVKPEDCEAFIDGVYAGVSAIKVEEGQDYATALGITKWLPPIPTHLAGDVEAVDLHSFASYTDIENIKKFPNLIKDGEIVYMTEKLHGTCLIFHYDAQEDRFFVSSKGLAGKSLALKESASNFYWRVARAYEIEDKLRHVIAFLNNEEEKSGQLPTTAVTLFGEGLGVQDLKYNQTGNDAAARFFDLRFTEYETGERQYAPYSSTTYFLSQMELPAVPTLHLGPFSQETLDFYTNGKETVTGKQTHVREGVVVQPMIPRVDNEIGRVILKSISPDYLLRKGDATEYE